MTILFHAARSATLALGLLIAVPAVADPAGEAELAQQLTAGTPQGAIRLGARIVLVPPQADASPIATDALEATMSRVALEFKNALSNKPEILAASSDLRQTLETTLAREGLDGWTKAVTTLVRQSADFALVGSAGLVDGKLTLELALLSMQDGSVLARTQGVPIDAPADQAADPEGGIASAVQKLLKAAPQARPEIVLMPFADGATGIPNLEVGAYLADIVEDAWLEAANTQTAMLVDAPPPQVIRDTKAMDAIALSGRIWLIDQNRTRLVLTLMSAGISLATQVVDISIVELPADLRERLDPKALGGGGGFSAVRALLGGQSPARLQMEVVGGSSPVFEVCETLDPDAIQTCDTLRLTVTADESGDLLCFSLGDDLEFSLLIPNDLYGPVRLEPRLPLVVPQGLLSVDGSIGDPVWYAYGPPAMTLVGCLLYRQIDAPLLATLTEWSGGRLPEGDARTLGNLLKRSNPRASAEAVVQIIDADSMSRFRRD
ncbi:hypothetical protein GEU84_020275 [Fertoebacter nigrum]|uniref:DUF4384 domain-containing protein n=1 Tax=Fertoeibacter niger TaxID=2656921 RepID=A0A8X8H6Q1_9RHOB|nr:hypothetical protein [Fertoeibacter niger]NUB46733.1 hypothetical protein [Fertoeibacter niger]